MGASHTLISLITWGGAGSATKPMGSGRPAVLHQHHSLRLDGFSRMLCLSAESHTKASSRMACSIAVSRHR